MEDLKDIDTLFRFYYKPMCLYAAHYLNDNAVVEDVVQDVFMALWQKIDKGEFPNSPKTYLFISVRNRCIDILRKQNLHPEEALPSDLSGPMPDDEAMARSFDEARIFDAIERLPKGRREMFLMHRRDKMKYSEIAERLGVSENTVRNQISRALNTLKGAIKK